MLPTWNRTSPPPPPPLPPPLRFIYSNRFGHDYKAGCVDVLLCVVRLHASNPFNSPRTSPVRINVSYAPLIIADGDSLHPRGIIFAKRSPLSFLFFFVDRELESLRIVHIFPLSFLAFSRNSRIRDLILLIFFFLGNFNYYYFDRWREDFLLLSSLSLSLSLSRAHAVKSIE